jgi:hypothetical protein
MPAHLVFQLCVVRNKNYAVSHHAYFLQSPTAASALGPNILLSYILNAFHDSKVTSFHIKLNTPEDNGSLLIDMKSPLLCKKGTTHKTSTLQEKQKTDFKDAFLFIANELLELAK